jgi:hypothetical protein
MIRSQAGETPACSGMVRETRTKALECQLPRHVSSRAGR